MSIGLVFTYLMSYGGAVVAIVNPFIGLLIYVCFSIFRPGSGLWYWSVPENGSFSKILAIGLLIGWALRGFGDWRFGRSSLTVIALLAYLIWSVLAISQALIPSFAWIWVESQSKIVLVVIAGITLIDSIAKLKQLAWVILISHGYVAFELNQDYFAGFNRLWEVGFGGMDNNCMAISLVSCSGLGIFLCLGTPKLWQKTIAAACVAFMIHAILFSFSRGGMVGLIIVIAFSFLLMKRRPIHYACLVFGIGLALAAAGDEVVKRFTSAFADENERDTSAEGRLEMWKICIRITEDYPLLGLGPHHFPVHATSFGLTPNKEAHSTWLQLAAEIGVPGALFLLAFFLVTVLRLWSLKSSQYAVKDPFLLDIARMVIASIVGFVFTAQFVTLPGLEAPYYIVLLGAGALRLQTVPGLVQGEVEVDIETTKSH
jgi:probable O-glycosylation ligase (exosortase A-associated)